MSDLSSDEKILRNDTMSCVVMLAVIVCVVLFGWYKWNMHKKDEEIRRVKSAYLSTVIERSKKIDKRIFKYEDTKGGSYGTKVHIQYIVTDAGIEIIKKKSSTTGSVNNRQFFWYGNVTDILRGYCGEEDYCMLLDGNFWKSNGINSDRLCYCFHKGVRRDEFVSEANKAYHKFKKEYEVLYERGE